MNNTGKEGGPELQREQMVHEFQGRVKLFLPEYSVTDRAEFDAYDPAADTRDRGQILRFYTERGRGEEDPNLMFTFRPGGFVVNYYNSPEPTTPYTVRRKNSSFYGPRDRRWQGDELDYALESARLRMTGIDLADPLVQGQVVGWSEKEQGWVRLGDKLETYQERMKQIKGFKNKVKAMYQPPPTIWDLWDNNPERATAVASARILGRGVYTILGESFLPEKAVKEIQEQSEAGKHIVQRELHLIDAQERLLREAGYL